MAAIFEVRPECVAAGAGAGDAKEMEYEGGGLRENVALVEDKLN